MAFTYDRLIAILGSLLREYDMNQDFEAQSELNAETEVYRVQTSAAVRLSHPPQAKYQSLIWLYRSENS